MKSRDYELLDSGNNEKMERFGEVVLSRPDPQALWPKRLEEKEWKKASGTFSDGGWILKENTPSVWQISLNDIRFSIRPTAFKHVGLFPEQTLNWEWLKNIVGSAGKEVEVLNLFGYTGGATLSLAKAGAKVVHVDSSKVAISWARENAEQSGLTEKPIRWIIDDARTFVRREVKRGRKYHGIIMDPPAFGHGPDSELWKIEEHLLPLLEDCMKILDDEPLFFLINGYSAGYSAIAYKNNLLTMVKKFGGSIEVGELTLEESPLADFDSRLLPAGIFARWSK